VGLTIKEIEIAKPNGKPYKLADGGGLCLLIAPSGAKLWRYRFDGKEKMMALGEYPLVTLKEVRERHLVARKTLDAGIDPMAERKAEGESKQREAEARQREAESSFESIARKWWEWWSIGKSPRHADTVLRRLDVYLILDNYGTHKTKLIRDWLAKRPRFHVHFTPTAASWLNLVERWFALLTERQLRRGVHRSTKELKAAIDDFIQHHNRDPKPFIWHKTAGQILDSVARFCNRNFRLRTLDHLLPSVQDHDAAPRVVALRKQHPTPAGRNSNAVVDEVLYLSEGCGRPGGKIQTKEVGGIPKALPLKIEQLVIGNGP
jgi:transposase